MTTSETPTPAALIAQVAAITRDRCGFIRVTLRGDELAHVSDGCVGGHLKLLIPREETDVLEDCRDDWRLSCFARTYTLAGHRPAAREIDIEFAVHPGKAGPGGSWARNARVGDRAMITVPKGKKLRRIDAGFYLIVCDSCSLPAASAAIRDLPADARGLLIAQCDEAADSARAVEPRPGIEARHLARDLSVPPSVNAANHLGVLGSADIPTADTECFVVGESRVVREIKHYVRDVLLLDTDGMYFSAYWKHEHDQDQHKRAKKAEREMGAVVVEAPNRATGAAV